MSMKSALVGALLLLGLGAGQSQASTYNIALDLASNGVGVDYTGTFDAPAAGGTLTAVNITIGAITYDTIDLGWLLPASYSPASNLLDGLALDKILDPLSTTQALFFVGGSFLSGAYTPECIAAGFCPADGPSGSYTITPASAVPLPAALPLLATALGALGFAGLRRKYKAA